MDAKHWSCYPTTLPRMQASPGADQTWGVWGSAHTALFSMELSVNRCAFRIPLNQPLSAGEAQRRELTSTCPVPKMEMAARTMSGHSDGTGLRLAEGSTARTVFPSCRFVLRPISNGLEEAGRREPGQGSPPGKRRAERPCAAKGMDSLPSWTLLGEVRVSRPWEGSQPRIACLFAVHTPVRPCHPTASWR